VDRVYSISRSDDGFETGHVDARIGRTIARGLRPRFQLMEVAVVLERIARRYQPPDAIEPQPLDREQADGAMGKMRWVERAAEQADAHAVGVKRDLVGEGLRRGQRLVQCVLRAHKAFSIDALSSREPVPTSLENAMGFTAASVPSRGSGI